MTFAEIQASDAIFLNPEDVREVLGCKPNTINVQAKEDPLKLGFPVCVMGTRVRIPRQAFVHWVMFGNAPLTKEAVTLQ